MQSKKWQGEEISMGIKSPENSVTLKNKEQSRSQDFAKRGGGLFLKFGSTVNELDPNFHLFSIELRQIQSVFLSKIE